MTRDDISSYVCVFINTFRERESRIHFSAETRPCLLLNFD